MNYLQLDENGVKNILIDSKFFNRNEDLSIEEIGDGNINMVFRVTGVSKSLIVKQAYPYVRTAGKSWPLNTRRSVIEADTLEVQSRISPGLVPEIYLRNNDLAVIVMEDLSHLGIMRTGMNEMKEYPNFTNHISTFLANQLFFTSDIYLNSEAKKKNVVQFYNYELCKITEDLIFTDPYYYAKRNKINPELKSYLKNDFWQNNNLKLEIAKLKYKFLSEAQCLLHGDLHTGSIFADDKETKVFDAEFAFYGPSGFDIGLLIGNIFINYFSWNGMDIPSEKIFQYQKYLLCMISEIYSKFENKFIKNWENNIQDISFKSKNYIDYYFKNIFIDSLGFASAEMIRRMHGFAHNIDIDRIQNLKTRSLIQVQVLKTASELMVKRYDFENILEVIDFIINN
ncbi:MAG: S-methyl-5-thioribose kinase [bacterium]|nr:S-methyl-5-thioribose kinase [bacterium]